MSLINFLKKHGINVYLVIWFLCMVLLFVTIYNVKFHLLEIEEEEKKKDKPKQVVSVVYEGFCDTGDNIAKKCGALKKSGAAACVTQDCCVWAKSATGSFCVEGGSGGPELNQDHAGKNFEQYYYQKTNKWNKIQN